MKLKYYYFVLLSFALTLVACDDDPVLLKDPVSALSMIVSNAVCLLHRIL